MKHKLPDDANINVKLDLPTEEITQIIDKVTEATVVVIAVATVAHIFRKVFE